jgi:Zn-finger nucleic acid-binding protein
MQCPADQTVLQMTERQGVEIDYCPTCRGVWLDRGELDKIIERSENQTVPAARPATPPPAPPPDPRTESVGYPAQAPYQQYPAYPRSPDSPDYRGGYQQGYDPRYGQRRKKQSFLGDLFDF